MYRNTKAVFMITYLHHNRRGRTRLLPKDVQSYDARGHSHIINFPTRSIVENIVFPVTK